MAKCKTINYFLYLAFLLTLIQPLSYIQAQSLKIKSYRIQPFPFEQVEVNSKTESIKITFAEYGTIAKVIYPAPKDRIPQDEQSIIEKCKEGLKKNIGQIIDIQKNNRAVKNYLTLHNKLSLLGRDDYFNLLVNPTEKNIQISPETKEIIAEFRSKEFALDDNAAFCVYLTFIYGPESESVEKIIISAVKLGRN